MKKPLKVGVTGGIGSGKSTVCKIFFHLKAPVYNADDRAKWLMVHDTELMAKIKQSFGEEAYNDGELNRSYLAREVFNEGRKVEELNALVHPRVRKDYQKWVADREEAPYVLREAALMIESGAYKDLDYLINVFAEEDTRISRVLKRDPHRSEDQVRQIIKKQVSEDKRQQLAHFVINNEDEMVIPQVLKLHDKFIHGSHQAA